MSLLWTDIETTGLDPNKHTILEVSAIVTDDVLNEIARFDRVVYSPIATRVFDYVALGTHENVAPAQLGVSAFTINMHLASGLWSASVHGEAIDSVDRDFAGFIQDHAVREVKLDIADADGKTTIDKPQLAGSTISFDRKFIEHHMPRSAALLHYRNIDVATFNETARRFWPELHAARPHSKDRAHRGMADIEESLRVYRHYLDALYVRVLAVPGAR